MIKSRSCSSGVTRATSAERTQSPMLKFNSKKTENLRPVQNPFTNPYPLKFPKRLMHKPTAMNMLATTQETNRKLCLKANPNAHKATMLEQCGSKRELKSGEFSHLAYESPSKPIRQREFQDIGTISNRKRPNENQYNSVSMLVSINENAENIGPDKFTKNIEKKHFKVTAEVKKQLEWKQDNQNKQRFQMKYKNVGKEKQKPAPSSNYSSIHLKYTTYK